VESETLMAFLAAGRRVEFVPVQVVASGRGSHIRPVADTIRWLRWSAGLVMSQRPTHSAPAELAPDQELTRSGDCHEDQLAPTR